MNSRHHPARAILTLCLVCTAAPVVLAWGQPAAVVSRPEVLADLQIWRDSGMDIATADPSHASSANTEYAKARVRYERMRASPEFAALVARIAARRGEPVPEAFAVAGKLPGK